MKWSWKIGKFAGIDVYLHMTFILLLVSIASLHWMVGQNLETMQAGLTFILALFGSVLLHEFGHALTAKAFGIGTRDITLLLPSSSCSEWRWNSLGNTSSLGLHDRR